MTGEEFIGLLKSRGLRPYGRHPKWRSRCPCHGSKSLTLAIFANTGQVRVACNAGCTSDDVLAALGLTWKDLAPRREWVSTEDFKKLKREEEAREAKARDLRIGKWVLRFLDTGYTQEDREEDMELACAAACALAGGAKPHWEETIRISFERMAAARHMLEHKMLGRVIAKPRW